MAPENSDLVPGVYEGGLKVWEASLDLVQHLLALGVGAPPTEHGSDGPGGGVGPPFLPCMERGAGRPAQGELAEERRCGNGGDDLRGVTIGAGKQALEVRSDMIGHPFDVMWFGRCADIARESEEALCALL